jgi:transposase-like protein
MSGAEADGTVVPRTSWRGNAGLGKVAMQSLQRALDIGSYQTAWAMLHRLRSVLVRPGRDLLVGAVEVDETFIGGEEAGLRGSRARGKKSLVGIAVEIREPKGIGRCRMAILEDASAASLRPFMTGNVGPGARVITDAWQGYHGLGSLGYTHERRSQRAARARGEDPGELLPAVRWVASLAKRWLLGTHQGSVDAAHLASYLDEFAFRFNRRRSASRGWCSTASWSSRPPTAPSATATWRPASRGCGHTPSRHRPAGARPASSGRRPDAPGVTMTWSPPVKWIPQTGLTCIGRAPQGRFRGVPDFAPCP